MENNAPGGQGNYQGDRRGPMPSYQSNYIQARPHSLPVISTAYLSILSVLPILSVATLPVLPTTTLYHLVRIVHRHLVRTVHRPLVRIVHRQVFTGESGELQIDDQDQDIGVATTVNMP
ncbi:hypothetical protein Tco_1161039 [Tanacetum coccineum]